MKNRYIKLLLATAACSSFVLVATEKVESINSAVDNFTVDKQKVEATAKSLVVKANELFFAAQYDAAANTYALAAYEYEKLKNNSEYFTAQYNKVKEMISKSRYYQAQETALMAQELANASDFDKAIELCQTAIKEYPAAEKEIQQRIDLYKKMRAAAVKRSALHESSVLPKQNEKEYSIRIKLKQAKMLYYSGQYELARKKYQEILMVDHLCLEAVQGQKACDVAIKKFGDQRFRLTHNRAMAEAAWILADPIIRKNQTETTDLTDTEGIKKSKADVNEETADIEKKLDTIRLAVNFDDNANGSTSLLDALRYLSGESGINFIPLYFTAKEGEQAESGAAPENGLGAATAANEDGEEEEEEEEEGAGKKAAANKAAGQTPNVQINYPSVNVKLPKSTLREIIEMLAQNTNTKYKIEKNAVLFAPLEAPLNDMQIKVFMFDESLLDSVNCDGEDSEELKDGIASAAEKSVKDLFPAGSNVMFDPKFRSLIVLNTPKNLELINDTLVQLRQTDPEPLVQVQVKFIEVEQSDLKELGFIQSLGRPNGDNGKTNGRLQFDNNDEVLNNSGANTVTFSTGSNGFNYNLTINAVNQANGKDILSSPKVLTKDGEKVTIRMISERYFAWDYEEGEVDSDTEGGVTITSVTPLWPEFQMQQLGIEMEITPKVDRKKRLISMDVHPWVKALVGWTEYDYYDENGELQKITRPIISERTTNTNVVIYNEETVVIGGMIKDYTVTVNDKVPLLGDIPLIGNFFKSKSTSVKKTNLLIFVTARILKPNGMPYYPSDTLGRPSSAGIGDLY